MANNIQKRIIINFRTVDKARKVKERQRVRESDIVAVDVHRRKRLKC